VGGSWGDWVGWVGVGGGRCGQRLWELMAGRAHLLENDNVGVAQLHEALDGLLHTSTLVQLHMGAKAVLPSGREPGLLRETRQQQGQAGRLAQGAQPD
jgi:hypothetical protein